MTLEEANEIFAAGEPNPYDPHDWDLYWEARSIVLSAVPAVVTEERRAMDDKFIEDQHAASRRVVEQSRKERDLVPRIARLEAACRAALQWVSAMRIVPGGERDRLKQLLESALEDKSDG